MRTKGGSALPPLPPHALVCQFWKFIWKILLNNKSPSSSPKYGKSYLLNNFIPSVILHNAAIAGFLFFLQ